MSPPMVDVPPFLARRESEPFLKKPGGLNPNGRGGVLLPEPRIGRGSISKRSRHEEEARCPRPDSFVARDLCRLCILRRFIEAGVAAAGFWRELGQGRAICTSEPACEGRCCPDGKTRLTVTGAGRSLGQFHIKYFGDGAEAEVGIRRCGLPRDVTRKRSIYE